MSPAASLAAGVLIGAGAVGGALTLLPESDVEATSAAIDTAPIVTATVTQQDVVLTDETVATLEFVDEARVLSPSSGTVTSRLSDGEIIEAGTIVATVDNQPVVVFYGDIPAWRSLDISSEDGSDIYQLELNLSMLGFDPEGTLEIDRTFDAATEDAVELFQESLDLEADGELPQSLVTYTTGRILVEGDAVTIGTSIQEGGLLTTGRVLERVQLVASTSEGDGSITNIAPIGTEIASGTMLFVDGETPVISIIGGQATYPILERDLYVGVADGIDVELLERTLTALGFDAGGTLTIDHNFDESTSQAVFDWHQSLGLPATDSNDSADLEDLEVDPHTLVVPAGSYVVLPEGLIVGEHLVAGGATPGADTPVLSLTSIARVITTNAPLGDETFQIGASIEVEYPDGTVSAGTVIDTGRTATNASGDPGATPLVTITIAPDAIPESAVDFVQIPVVLRIVTETIPDALLVPTSALVALSEGGYAVEIADNEMETHLVAVELGTFFDGFVQVSGTGIASGLDVVVPG